MLFVWVSSIWSSSEYFSNAGPLEEIRPSQSLHRLTQNYHSFQGPFEVVSCHNVFNDINSKYRTLYPYLNSSTALKALAQTTQDNSHHMKYAHSNYQVLEFVRVYQFDFACNMMWQSSLFGPVETIIIMSNNLSTSVKTVAWCLTGCGTTGKKPTLCSSMCSVDTNELKVLHDGIFWSSQEGLSIPLFVVVGFILVNVRAMSFSSTSSCSACSMTKISSWTLTFLGSTCNLISLWMRL